MPNIFTQIQFTVYRGSSGMLKIKMKSTSPFLVLSPSHFARYCLHHFDPLQLGFKTAVGMPFKDIATADSVYLEELPAADDKAARTALRRMQEVIYSRVLGC